MLNSMPPAGGMQIMFEIRFYIFCLNDFAYKKSHILLKMGKAKSLLIFCLFFGDINAFCKLVLRVRENTIVFVTVL